MVINQRNYKKVLAYITKFPSNSKASNSHVMRVTGVDDLEAVKQAKRVIRAEHYPNDSISAKESSKKTRKIRAEKRENREVAIKSNFKRLFMDIETSYCQGWFWRPSYKTSISYNQIFKPAAIICICYKWEGDDEVSYLTWDKGDDKAMMEKFYKILLKADECISHNGDNFDLKWVRTKFLQSGFTSMPEIKSIDTLKIARAKFNFPSNKLNDIGITLGIGQKVDTGGIDLWHEIILKNSRSALKKMVEYCQNDVILLEKIFLKIKGFTPGITHRAIHIDGDRYDCPECTSVNVFLSYTRTTINGTIKRQMCCKDCGTYFQVSNKTYMDYLQNKRDIRAMSLKKQ